MSNREQRRAGKRLKNHPLIKEKVNKLAMEMTQMLFTQCEDVMKDLKEVKNENEKIDTHFTQEMSEQWKQKGKDLGSTLKDMAAQIHSQISSEAKKMNLETNRNTIQYKLQASKRH